jgi:Coenzyme PQQ synthesis protein D (PqqD)
MAEERWVRRPGFVTRRVAGETVVVPVLSAATRVEAGGPQLDFVVLNETAEALWAALSTARSVPELARELMNSYDLREDEAIADCSAFVASLKEIGAVAATG